MFFVSVLFEGSRATWALRQIHDELPRTQEEPEGMPVHVWRKSAFEGQPKLDFEGAEATRKKEGSLSLGTSPPLRTTPLGAIPCCSSLRRGFRLHKAWKVSLHPKPHLWLRKAQIPGIFPQPSMEAESCPKTGPLAWVEFLAKHRESYQGQRGQRAALPPSIELSVP